MACFQIEDIVHGRRAWAAYRYGEVIGVTKYRYVVKWIDGSCKTLWAGDIKLAEERENLSLLVLINRLVMFDHEDWPKIDEMAWAPYLVRRKYMSDLNKRICESLR